MTKTGTIRFYDVKSALEPLRGWSPNAWRARLFLNYFEVKSSAQYETIFISYPSIKGEVTRLYAEGNAGEPNAFTLPLIEDPKTSPPTIIMDSGLIAKYLCSAYSSSPIGGMEKFDEYFDWTSRNVQQFLRGYLFLDVWKNLDEEGKIYFRESRERIFGCKLENMMDRFGGEEATLDLLRKGWKPLQDRMKGRPEDDEATALDFCDGAMLKWTENINQEKYERLLDLWGPEDDSVRKLAKIIAPYGRCT